MTRERQHGHRRPGGKIRRAMTLDQPREEEQRKRREKHEQRIRPGLLRVPNEDRATSHQQRSEQTHPPASERTRDEVRDRDGGGAQQRRQRAKGSLAPTEDT